MGVYVDDMRAPYGRMILCHMFADSREELDVMADAIGVARRWIQKAGTPGEHYDVSLGCRAKAVRLGAVEITRRRTVAIVRRRRARLAEAEASATLDAPDGEGARTVNLSRRPR